MPPRQPSAKERAREKARAEEEKKKKVIEDLQWRETDKNVLRKQARKDEKDTKKVVDQQKKQEKKKLADEEMNTIEKEIKTKKPTAKVLYKQVSQSEILNSGITAGRTFGHSVTNKLDDKMRSLSLETNDNEVHKKPKNVVVQDLLIDINNQDKSLLEASGVDKTLALLNSLNSASSVNATANEEEITKVFVTYEMYEKSVLPQLKIDFPTLKLSQLKQLAHRAYMKEKNLSRVKHSV